MSRVTKEIDSSSGRSTHGDFGGKIRKTLNTTHVLLSSSTPTVGANFPGKLTCAASRVLVLHCQHSETVCKMN